MQFLLMHISDIHFLDENSYDKKIIDDIVKAMYFARGLDNAIIAISGDLTFEATEEQFIIAELFINDLRKNINSKLGIRNIQVAVVPGNHDIDLNNCLNASDMFKITKEKNQKEYIDTEKSRLHNFYVFSKNFDCFTDNHYICKKDILFGNTRIKVNLINTAIFSSKNADQGYHYLPLECINDLRCNADEDFIITIMHHPTHWFCMDCKIRLDDVLYKNSDLILLGHEHSPHISTNNSIEGGCIASFMLGGKLSNKGKWEHSEFYAGIIDTDSRNYHMHHFEYDYNKKIYNDNNGKNIKLERRRANNYGFAPKAEYLKVMFDDTKYSISGSILDYYVFPEIIHQKDNETKDSKIINDVSEFLNIIKTNKRISILGKDESGKSLLARYLFKCLSEFGFAIFINGKEIINRDYERMIKKAFEDIYSDSRSDYDRFRQADKEDRILVVDNFETIDTEKYADFLDFIEGFFGIIVKTEKDSIQFNMLERIKQRRQQEQYQVYNICPFYLIQRRKLIESVVKISLSNQPALYDRVVRNLLDSVNRQKKVFSTSPAFIICFTRYYCINANESIQNDGNIFSKVFEANIVSLIYPNTTKMHVDKIFILLDKIAYTIYKSRKHPLNISCITDIVEKYNYEYGSDVGVKRLLDILLKSNILYEEGNDYGFINKNHFTYFVAREIKRKCQDENDYTDFDYILKYSYKEIYSDIILFITFITDNLSMIRRIIKCAEESVKDWNEINLDNIEINYLKSLNTIIDKPLKESDRQNVEFKEDKYERQNQKELCHCNELNDEFEDEQLTIFDEMMRALSLMLIVSKVLPGFEHLMRRQEKDNCVNLIYTMPLKIFNIWAQQVDKTKGKLIDYIQKINSEIYNKDSKEIKVADAEELLRVESIMLFLEILNASISNSTRDNTLAFMDLFEFKGKTAYRIAHLMSLDTRDNVEKFVDEAVGLHESINEPVVNSMLKRVTRHFLLHSKIIQEKNIQRLNSKIWEGRYDDKKLLVHRIKNADRK